MKKSKYDIRRTVEVEDWGKITARASTLNSISIMLSVSSELNRRQGFIPTAELRDRQSQQIYEVLKATGLYDDLN